MSVTADSSQVNQSPASRWRLWIDGCGGFLLLTGQQWEVGTRDQSPPDISAMADWPRSAGHIIRDAQDYFWQTSESKKRELIIPGTRVPTGGSANMSLQCPSSLSQSAVLTLKAPHRFANHVDGILLVDRTILIGPNTHSHIQTHHFDEQAILLFRDGQWNAKLSGESKFASFSEAEKGRIVLGSLVMTLEPA